MMRKLNAALLLPLLLATASIAAGQEETRPSAEPARPEVRVAPTLYFREITLDLVDGTRVGGRLIGANLDLVRFRTAAGDRDVPLRDIRRAVVRTEKGLFAPSGVLPGAALGLYVGNGLSWEAFRVPGFYLESYRPYDPGGTNFWIILLEGFYAAAGGSLGWLASSGARVGTFALAADGEAGGAARTEFVRFITEGLGEPRFHILVQGGQLVAAVTPKLDEGLAGAGLTLLPYHDLSTFSYLRAVQVVRSAGPRSRAGLRVSFPSEPMALWTSTGGIGLRQGFRATALHVVFSASPVPAKPGSRISWNAGLGAGVAWVRLDRTLFDYDGSEPPDGTFALETSGLRPSAVAFTTLELRMTRAFSAGVAADYTFLGSAEAPGLPDYGIAAQKLGLGNGSIGFVLGFHL